MSDPTDPIHFSEDDVRRIADNLNETFRRRERLGPSDQDFVDPDAEPAPPPVFITVTKLAQKGDGEPEDGGKR